MKHPSKRHKAIQDAIARRDEALTALRDAALVGRGAKARGTELAEAEMAIIEAENSPDAYTCIQCGKDFTPKDHLDIAAMAVLDFTDGIPARYDYGLQDVRRLEFCKKCKEGWAIQPAEYLNLR